MFLSTREVAEIFRVTQNTIRSWEYKKILIPAYKSPTGRRGYSREQVDELLRRGLSNECNAD